MALYSVSVDEALQAVADTDLPQGTKDALAETLEANAVDDMISVLNVEADADIDSEIANSPPATQYNLPAADLQSLSTAARDLLADAGAVTFAGSDPVMLDLGEVDGVKTYILGAGNDVLTLAGVEAPGSASAMQYVDAGDGDDEVTTDAGDQTFADTAGDDQMSSGAGDDRFEFGSGTDMLDGGAGFDAATLIQGPASSGGFGFAYDADTNVLRVTNADGDQTLAELTNVNYISNSAAADNNFESGVVVVVNDAEDANTANLYQVALGRRPDEGGFDFWTADNETSDIGGTDQALAQATGFVNSAEFQTQIEGMSTTQIVEMLYQNAFAREADAAGLEYWVNQIDNEGVPLEKVITDFMYSTELEENPFDWNIRDDDIV